MSRHCLVWLLVCAGCSFGDPGESGYVECTNGVDDDLDGLTDCADTGCQSLDGCLRGLPIPMPAGDPPLAPRGGPSVTLPIDGSVTPEKEDDAGLDLGDDDAGTLPDAMMSVPPADAGAQCVPACTGTQQCTDKGECKDVGAVTQGRFVVQILSARVPNMNLIMQCLDIDCGSLPFAVCRCRPDPLVRVMRIRPTPDGPMPEQSVEVGRTPPVSNDERPEWSNARFEVELLPGDALRFEVYDADLGEATFVFECAPDLTELREGPLSCIDYIYAQRAEVNAVLEAL